MFPETNVFGSALLLLLLLLWVVLLSSSLLVGGAAVPPLPMGGADFQKIHQKQIKIPKTLKNKKHHVLYTENLRYYLAYNFFRCTFIIIKKKKIS